MLFRPTLPLVAHCGPAGDSSRGWCRFPNQVTSTAAAPTAATTRTAQQFFVCVGRTVSVSASGVTLAWFCRLWATEGDTSPDREKSLELIRYLMPEALNGALVDSLSGHALSAAGLAASFLLEGTERARLTAPPTSICSVIRAHKPGWCLVIRSARILVTRNTVFILSILLILHKKPWKFQFYQMIFQISIVSIKWNVCRQTVEHLNALIWKTEFCLVRVQSDCVVVCLCVMVVFSLQSLGLFNLTWSSNIPLCSKQFSHTVIVK